MALRFMKWITVLVALCGSSYVWAAMEPVSWDDQIRARRDSSTLMDVASGASLLLGRDSLLSGWFDISHRDRWFNTRRLSQSPDSAASLNLSVGHMAAITLIASSTVQSNSWVSFSEGPAVSIHLMSITVSEFQLSSAPLVVSLDPSAAVPLPAAGWLFGSALVGVAGFARRRYESTKLPQAVS
jgi:hypothetical protein